jgi:3-methylfumaryl-CoA hydratase
MPVGCRVERTSTIAGVAEKSGQSGRLIFVDVEHSVGADGAPCLRESQTIVYREAPSGPHAPGPISDQPRDWPWMALWPTDPVLLFRYSALTFNGHRIHYDQPYATEVEGYPGLVVHGPLMATLMLDLCDRRLGPNRLSRFSFRGLGPAFCGETLAVAGRPEGDTIDLKVFTEDGRTVMTGQGATAPGSAR